MLRKVSARSCFRSVTFPSGDRRRRRRSSTLPAVTAFSTIDDCFLVLAMHFDAHICGDCAREIRAAFDAGRDAIDEILDVSGLFRCPSRDTRASL